MNKNIAIYGSTGSIGTQALDIMSKTGIGKPVALVSGGSRIELLADQVRTYSPTYVGVIDEEKENALKDMIRNTNPRTIVTSGMPNCIGICLNRNIDMIINSAVGIAGLVPTIAFAQHGKRIGLANKESLVTGGALVMDIVKQNNATLIPIDSEHSAILQCLQRKQSDKIESLTITASGGPFRGKTRNQLWNVTVEEALNHPTWRMGGRITIDSATLMNKGFEIIEARWLFGVEPENIKVVVHPQSIVHSWVNFEDGSDIAMTGSPDMRIPIQYAITYPARVKNHLPRTDYAKIGTLTFSNPDMETFKCLALAYEAIKMGGTAPAVLNGADERAVEYFLKGKIGFLAIANFIETALRTHTVMTNPGLEEIFAADKWARQSVDASYRQMTKATEMNLGEVGDMIEIPTILLRQK